MSRSKVGGAEIGSGDGNDASHIADGLTLVTGFDAADRGSQIIVTRLTGTADFSLVLGTDQGTVGSGHDAFRLDFSGTPVAGDTWSVTLDPAGGGSNVVGNSTADATPTLDELISRDPVRAGEWLHRRPQGHDQTLLVTKADGGDFDAPLDRPGRRQRDERDGHGAQDHALRPRQPGDTWNLAFTGVVPTVPTTPPSWTTAQGADTEPSNITGALTTAANNLTGWTAFSTSSSGSYTIYVTQISRARFSESFSILRNPNAGRGDGRRHGRAEVAVRHRAAAGGSRDAELG